MATRDASDDERAVMARLIKEARARPPLRSSQQASPPGKWCPTCRAERARPEVRLMIAGREARHVCRQCGTVLEREGLPF